MCDYSLHGVSSRPAKVGDKLVTTQFWNTSTRGFSAADEPRVAVCLLPGTEVAFENKIERHLTGFQLFLRRTKVLPHRVARFRQVNMDNPCTHHDALEFPGGQIVLLTHLRAGQQATVLQLPAQPKTADAVQSPAQVRHHPLLQSGSASRADAWASVPLADMHWRHGFFPVQMFARSAESAAGSACDAIMRQRH